MTRCIAVAAGLFLFLACASRGASKGARTVALEAPDASVAGLLALLEPPPVDAPRAYVPHALLIDEIDEKDVVALYGMIGQAIQAHEPRVAYTINSNGGSVDLAQKMVMLFDLAREHDVRVDCVVDGRAWSAAAYVLQSCTTRSMTKRSTVMFHEPHLSEAEVAPADLHGRTAARARLDAVAQAVAEQSASRLRVGLNEYLAHVRDGGEWWLTWADAVTVGAVDRAVPSVLTVWAR